MDFKITKAKGVTGREEFYAYAEGESAQIALRKVVGEKVGLHSRADTNATAVMEDGTVYRVFPRF